MYAFGETQSMAGRQLRWSLLAKVLEPGSLNQIMILGSSCYVFDCVQHNSVLSRTRHCALRAMCSAMFVRSFLFNMVCDNHPIVYYVFSSHVFPRS